MPRPLGSIETVTDQLPRTYKINVQKNKKQEEHYTQVVSYSVRLPSRIGAAWIEALGKTVTFRITEEGLLIVPEPPTDDIRELLNKELFKDLP
jgi:hypothetical protein